MTIQTRYASTTMRTAPVPSRSKYKASTPKVPDPHPHDLWADPGVRPACGGCDPAWFDTDSGAELLELGKQVCSGCPLAQPCLANGIAGAESGLWGGVTLERGVPVEVKSPARGPQRQVRSG